MKKYLLSLFAMMALGCAFAFAEDAKKDDHKESKECQQCKEKGSTCDSCKKAQESHEKH
jgi:hypothetical protein